MVCHGGWREKLGGATRPGFFVVAGCGEMLERPVRVGKAFRLFFDKARSLKRKYKQSCVLRRATAAPPPDEKKGSVFRAGVWILLGCFIAWRRRLFFGFGNTSLAGSGK